MVFYLHFTPLTWTFGVSSGMTGAGVINQWHITRYTGTYDNSSLP